MARLPKTKGNQGKATPKQQLHQRGEDDEAGFAGLLAAAGVQPKGKPKAKPKVKRPRTVRKKPLTPSPSSSRSQSPARQPKRRTPAPAPAPAPALAQRVRTVRKKPLTPSSSRSQSPARQPKRRALAPAPAAAQDPAFWGNIGFSSEEDDHAAAGEEAAAAGEEAHLHEIPPEWDYSDEASPARSHSPSPPVNRRGRLAKKALEEDSEEEEEETILRRPRRRASGQVLPNFCDSEEENAAAPAPACDSEEEDAAAPAAAPAPACDSEEEDAAAPAPAPAPPPGPPVAYASLSELYDEAAVFIQWCADHGFDSATHKGAQFVNSAIAQGMARRLPAPHPH